MHGARGSWPGRVQVRDSEHHYLVLGLRKSDDPTPADIRKAYKRMAMKHHPDRIQNQGDKETAEAAFKEISEAYEVLIDPHKKQQYDAGRDPHAQPPPRPDGGYGWNPWQADDDEEDEEYAAMICELLSIPRTVQVTLEVPLEDFCSGGQHRVPAVIYVAPQGDIGFDSLPYAEGKVYSVSVRPGWRPGHTVRFERVGAALQSVQVTIKAAPHPRFTLSTEADGEVHIWHALTREEVKAGVAAKLPSLYKGEEGIVLNIKPDSKTVRESRPVVLDKEGLPLTDSSSGEVCGRGDLVIHLRVMSMIEEKALIGLGKIAGWANRLGLDTPETLQTMKQVGRVWVGMYIVYRVLRAVHADYRAREDFKRLLQTPPPPLMMPSDLWDR